MKRVMQNPIQPVAGIYRHYKGQRYRVLGMAQHSETLEPLVVYQALYGNHGLWVRPAAMFCETVELDGEQVPPVRTGTARRRSNPQPFASLTHPLFSE